MGRFRIRIGSRPSNSVSQSGWHPLKIGAGGFLTGIDIAPDGTAVVRTDTYGAYLLVGSTWQQLVTSNSMPVDDYLPMLYDTGVFEIRIAPSNSNILFMYFKGRIYRSTNKGTTWTRTNFTATDDDNANGSDKLHGCKLAINPNDPDHVITGTPSDGVFETTDGGDTWSLVTDVSAGTGGYANTVCFVDASNIFISRRGTGVYRSTNGGSSYSLTSSGPTHAYNYSVASNGTLWCVEFGNSNYAWKFASGSWTKLNNTDSSDGRRAVCCDPADPNHVITVGDGTTPTNETFDAGATWTGNYWIVTIAATDVPWIANAPDNYLSCGNVVFHPTNGKLYNAMGYGCLTTTHPSNNVSLTVTWTSLSAGIEQLVTNKVLAVPGYKPLVACWDRPIAVIDDPDEYMGDYFRPNDDNNIMMCWDIAYLPSNPSKVVAVINYGTDESGYSNDGGDTWTNFTSLPSFVGPDHKYGFIATAAAGHILWCGGLNNRPEYTKDNGVTWNLLPGFDSTGWISTNGINHHAACADSVTSDKYYLYNYETGVWVSTDGGDNWTNTSGTFPAGFYNVQLAAIPGHAGHVIFTAGEQGSAGQESTSPDDNLLYLSTDGADTFNAVPNVKEPIRVGFGAQIGSGYSPTVFLAGWVDDGGGYEFGIWQSVDFNQSTPTWTKIGDYPNGCFDRIMTVAGDMDIPGRCYVGFKGSGAQYYTP